MTLVGNFSIVSKKSNFNHWWIGVYLPVIFIASCETIPPKNTQIGFISALQNLKTLTKYSLKLLSNSKIEYCLLSLNFK